MHLITRIHPREEGASGSRTLPLSTRVRASLDACVLSAPNGHGLEVVGAGATCALSKCTVEQCRGEGLRAAEGGRASFTKGAVMGSKASGGWVGVVGMR